MVHSQLPFAQTGMVNSLAFKIREEIQKEMRQKLEQPKPYTLNMLRVQKAKKSLHPVSRVFTSDFRNEENTLGHLFQGGDRNWKGMEAKLRRMDILRDGYYAVPGDGAPSDRYGNIKPSFVQMLISYFQGWDPKGGEGVQNMSPEKIKRKAKESRNKKTGYKTINGVRYFGSFGRLSQWDARDLFDTTGLRIRPQPLAYGIWAKTGIHGHQVKPVLMFVPKKNPYKRYFNLPETSQQVLDEYSQKYFAEALLKGIATSKHLRELQRGLRK